MDKSQSDFPFNLPCWWSPASLFSLHRGFQVGKGQLKPARLA